MLVADVLIFEGRNYYSHKPAAKVTVDLESLAGKESKEFAGFEGRLLATLPGLAGHACAGQAGGFVSRLRDGTYFGHILEHIILELQAQVGYDITFGKTRQTGRPGTYEVVFEYGLAVLVRPLVELAVKLVEAAIAGKSLVMTEHLAHLRKIAAQADLGPSTRAIVQAARKRGISVRRVGNDSLVQLGTGKNLRRVQATLGPYSSCLAADVACDKSMTKLILSKAGIPVPFGLTVETPEEAVEAWRLVGRPVAIKPRDGNQGKGVSLNLNTIEEVEDAFSFAQRYGAKVIVEEYIEGKHYRLLVVDTTLVAAAERIPAQVIADGHRTVEELIALANEDPLRGEKHEKPLTRMQLDDLALTVLRRQGLTPHSIPRQGQVVMLRDSANLSTGGVAIDVTDQVHPTIRHLAERVSRIMGLDIAGIDMVVKDIAEHFSTGSVIEVNAAPGIRMHLYPSQGKARDVASAILDMIYPPGSASEIPLVAVTGTNGKTTTTRLIAACLRRRFKHVGMTTSAGIYVDDDLLVSGDTTGPWSANVVLGDPIVEAAVLEVARGGILRGGLGYDLADVAVVTNIAADHLGQDGVDTLEDLARVKGLVTESVRPQGSVVINAEDHFCRQLGALSKRHQIMFSTVANHHLLEHLGRGGKAVYATSEDLLLTQGSDIACSIPLTDIPLTFRGLAIHNIANCTAAAAALWALGMEFADIRATLTTFLPDLRSNPGRQNIIQVAGRTVMIDYGHNVAGIEAIGSLVRQLCTGRVIGVVCAPGDRSDELIRSLGAAAGKAFSEVFIKEDLDLRGREPGETARLIKAGLEKSGLPESRTHVELEERKALTAAIELAQSHDLVVIFYESLELTLELLADYEKRAEKQPEEMVVAGVVGR